MAGISNIVTIYFKFAGLKKAEVWVSFSSIQAKVQWEKPVAFAYLVQMYIV